MSIETMNVKEIKDLIASKIAGQGSAIDAGSALPGILNGIVDVMSKGYTLISNSTSALLYSGADQRPDCPQDGSKVFCMGWGLDEDTGEPVSFEICVPFADGTKYVWNGQAIAYIYNDAATIEDNADETDGYITPKGLIDYVKDQLQPVYLSARKSFQQLEALGEISVASMASNMGVTSDKLRNLLNGRIPLYLSSGNSYNVMLQNDREYDKLYIGFLELEGLSGGNPVVRAASYYLRYDTVNDTVKFNEY